MWPYTRLFGLNISLSNLHKPGVWDEFRLQERYLALARWTRTHQPIVWSAPPHFCIAAAHCFCNSIRIPITLLVFIVPEGSEDLVVSLIQVTVAESEKGPSATTTRSVVIERDLFLSFFPFLVARNGLLFDFAQREYPNSGMFVVPSLCAVRHCTVPKLSLSYTGGSLGGGSFMHDMAQASFNLPSAQKFSSSCTHQLT